MRNLILTLQSHLFAKWLMCKLPVDHPVEWVLYHSYISAGRLANAMRPR